jgi:hypothetical protein
MILSLEVSPAWVTQLGAGDASDGADGRRLSACVITFRVLCFETHTHTCGEEACSCMRRLASNNTAASGETCCTGAS